MSHPHYRPSVFQVQHNNNNNIIIVFMLIPDRMQAKKITILNFARFSGKGRHALH